MNIPLFIGIAGLLGGIYIWIGKRASKDLQTNDDYFLMGRKLSFFPLTLTLLATQLGGGTLLGAAEEAYDKGWPVLFYPLGVSLGLLILGMGFGGKLRRLNISTVAEIFVKIYGSQKQRHLASGLSIVALFFILTAQGIAARKFFASIGVEGPLLFTLFWTVLVAYTVMGGLKAVVNTDMLQALFIIGVLAATLFFLDLSKAPSLSFTGSVDTRLSDIPWSSWMFMPLLFMLIEQDMGQRCFAAKNPRVISASAIAAGITLLLCSIIAVYFGILAKNLGIEAEEGKSILIQSIQALTNPVVSTFFIAAIFIAVISTADSLLCSISSNLSCDFLSAWNMSNDRRLNISRLLTLITGLGALGAAFMYDNVVMILMISYELSVCILFVPIAAAVLMKNPSKRGASAAMVLGALGFVLFRVAPPPFPKEIAAIGLSLLGYFGCRNPFREATRNAV